MIDRSLLVREASLLAQCDRLLPALHIDRPSDVARSSIHEARIAGDQIIGLDTPGAHVESSARRAATRGLSKHIKIYWQLSGSTSVESARGNIHLHAGDLTILSVAQNYRCEADTDFSVLVLEFDWSERPLWRSIAGSRTGERISGSSAGNAAGAAVGSLLRHADGGRGDLFTIEAGLDLVFRSFAEGKDYPASIDCGGIFVRRAAALVCQNIGNRAYTPDCLARDLGRSRRALYKDFAAIGMTPSDFIRRIRLDTARAEIVRNRSDRVSLTEIAARNGFADGASFSHAFKAMFGIAPSTLVRRSD